MRADYLLYGVALVCLILALCLVYSSVYSSMFYAITLVILCAIFAGVGYSLRPEEAAVEAPAAPAAPKTTPTVEAKPRIELTEVKGIGPKRSEQLKSAGILTVQELAQASAGELANKLGVSPKVTGRWVEEAKRLLGET